MCIMSRIGSGLWRGEGIFEDYTYLPTGNLKHY